MDAESATTGRYFDFSRASELVATADSALHLQVYAHLPGGRSYFVARDGQTVVANDAS